jgi:2-hydroxycyclohexanecarboxyl-CoA dehydrogenase
MTIEHPVAIITGGGAGIGKACAIRFAREGYNIVVVDWIDTDGQATVDLLKSSGTKPIFCHADVSVERECIRFAELAIESFGRIDVLVASAGVRAFGTILETAEKDWDRILGVNVKGVSFSCKAVLPKMIQQKSGAIVMLGSAGAMSGRSDSTLYNVTKFGILGLTRSLAAIHGKDGIRVNTICPGRTLTDFIIKKAEAEGVSIQALRERNKNYGLLGRPAEPEEIAAAIYFMASKEASFITGQYLMVDGGVSIRA